MHSQVSRLLSSSPLTGEGRGEGERNNAPTSILPRDEGGRTSCFLRWGRIGLVILRFVFILLNRYLKPVFLCVRFFTKDFNLFVSFDDQSLSL